MQSTFGKETVKTAQSTRLHNFGRQKSVRQDGRIEKEDM